MTLGVVAVAACACRSCFFFVVCVCLVVLPAGVRQPCERHLRAVAMCACGVVVRGGTLSLVAFVSRVCARSAALLPVVSDPRKVR